MMRQIVEWLIAALPFILIGMLFWTVAVQNIRIKRLTYERYRTMELIRVKIGRVPIPWRGSIAKYNEDIDKAEAR